MIGKLLNRSTFLSPESVKLFHVEDQEGVNCEGTPVKAPPASRRKIMPPTPQQSSYSSIETKQWQTEVEDQEIGRNEKEFEGQHRWNVRDRTVIARMEQYLNESDCMKLENEELELLLGPADSGVNLRDILRYASRRSGRIFEIFSSKGHLDPWDSVRLRTASTQWNVPGKYGARCEVFFFLLKREPTVLSEVVEFGPCVSDETVKARAWIGLHMMAEENAFRSDSDVCPDFGDMWRNGCR